MDKHYHFWIIDSERGRMAMRGRAYRSRRACNSEAARLEPDPEYRFVKSCTRKCRFVRRRTSVLD